MSIEREHTCSWQMATVVSDDSMVLTPAATAMVASPLSRPLCARWPATRDDEQAVSVLTQGPVNPKVYDTLETDTQPWQSNLHWMHLYKRGSKQL